MSWQRRIRGLLGTALTWAGIGVVLGPVAFLAAFPPWPLSSVRWGRFFSLFAAWEFAALLWGAACGVAFSVVMMALARRRRLSDLPLGKVALWGAMAGAAFPTLIAVRPVLHGASPLYFGAIIGASALAGAWWARTSVAMARRLPESPDPASLHEASPSSHPTRSGSSSPSTTPGSIA